MAPVIALLVEHFPSILDLNPLSDEFTCIYPLASKGFRRCRNRIDKKTDRPSAYTLWRKVLQCPLAQDTPQILEQIASLACCRQNHRTEIQDALRHQLCRRWQLELGLEVRDDGVSLKCGADATSNLSLSTTGQRGGCKSPPPHSYNLRSSHSKSSLDTCTAAVPVTHSEGGYVPYVKGPSCSVASILARPITPQTKKTGSTYIFNRANDPGMLKIGATTVSVPGRLASIGRKCNYIPLLQHMVADVPHVFRVEKLTHCELSDRWRRERQCKTNPNCPVRHQEWFETEVQTAVPVAEGWAEWMTKAKPFDGNGLLRRPWQIIINRMQAEGEVITALKMLDALKAAQWIEAKPPSLQQIQLESRAISPQRNNQQRVTQIHNPTALPTRQVIQPIQDAPVSSSTATFPGTHQLAPFDSDATMVAIQSLIMSLTSAQIQLLQANLSRLADTTANPILLPRVRLSHPARGQTLLRCQSSSLTMVSA